MLSVGLQAAIISPVPIIGSIILSALLKLAKLANRDATEKPEKYCPKFFLCEMLFIFAFNIFNLKNDDNRAIQSGQSDKIAWRF